KKSKYAFRIGKVLSKSSSGGGFSTALAFRPESAEEQKHGNIHFVIDIGSASPLAPDIAYNLIDIIKEEYYRDLSASPSESFESALRSANEEFAAIAKEGEKDWIGKTNVTIAVITGNKLLVVHRGTNELHLLRDGKLMHLSADLYTPGESYKPEETLTNVIEGDLTVGDKLITSTAELLYYYSVDKIKHLLSNHSPDEAARMLAEELGKEREINKTNVLIAEITSPEMMLDEEVTNEDNWVGGPTKDYGRKFTPAAPSAQNKENLWGKTGDDTKKSEEETKQIKDRSLKAQAASDMAQEFELDDDEDLSLDDFEDIDKPKVQETPTEPAKKFPSLKLPKINYDNLGQRVSSITSTTQQIAANPVWKRIFLGFWRYTKYAGLMVVAVVDLIFTSVSYWVDEVRKYKHGNRILFAAVGVLAIVLVASTLTLANNQTARISKKTAVESLENAIQKRDAAKAALIYDDVGQANALLVEAFALAEAAGEHRDTEKDAANVLADVKDQLDDINRVKRYPTPRVEVDFAGLNGQLESSGGNGTAVAINNFFTINKDVYSYDIEHNKIYKYNYARNESGIINSLVSSEKRIELGAPTDKGLIVYTSPPGIYKLDTSDNRMGTANLDSGSWTNATDIIAYTSKIYLLDPENNQVWKYQSTADGYTRVAPFFEDNTNISLAGTTSMAIDGDLYLLMNGSINKYTIGQQVEFIMRDIPEHTGGLGTISDIYTDVASSNVYALDAENNRVIAFTKDGEYRRQHVFNNIENPTKLHVNESAGSIWLMSGTQIYKLDM
ncbi:MAG: hypothetical protein U9M89_01520, partial [Patescibacteria group bacterium]|nr:hypothetical protein [Patescibacteria group bacterium]